MFSNAQLCFTFLDSSVDSFYIKDNDFSPKSTNILHIHILCKDGLIFGIHFPKNDYQIAYQIESPKNAVITATILKA